MTHPSKDTEDIWRKAVDELLTINFIGSTNGCETVEDAIKCLGILIEFEIEMAQDPKINGGYKLVKV